LAFLLNNWWYLLLIAAFAYMMFKGGGCCGGHTNEGYNHSGQGYRGHNEINDTADHMDNQIIN